MALIPFQFLNTQNKGSKVLALFVLFLLCPQPYRKEIANVFVLAGFFPIFPQSFYSPVNIINNI